MHSVAVIIHGSGLCSHCENVMTSGFWEGKILLHSNSGADVLRCFKVFSCFLYERGSGALATLILLGEQIGRIEISIGTLQSLSSPRL